MDPLNQNPTPTPVTPVNSTPAQATQPMQQAAQPQQPMPAPKRTHWGALLGILIILALLVVAALFFWGKSQLARNGIVSPDLNSEIQQPTNNQQVTQSALSDEEIEAFDSLEAETGAINVTSSSEIDTLAQ